MKYIDTYSAILSMYIHALLLTLFNIGNKMNQVYSTPIPSWHADPPLDADNSTPIIDRVSSGDYRAVVTGVQRVKPAQHDAYLLLNYLIIMGPEAGKTVVDRLFIEHPDQRIQNEEHARLSCIMHGIGLHDINGKPEAFEGKPFEIRVVTVGRTCVVTNYRAVNGIWLVWFV